MLSRAWTPMPALAGLRLRTLRAAGRFGRLEAAFLLLLAVALGMRLWELGGRTMHYDEAIHLYYSWLLANGDGFIHSPWMHGPFQIEATALVLGLLGDTDFTARLGYVLFGTALVGLPYFLRGYIGSAGAFLTGVMLALSPALLYFSRFGRNDIIMAFWATALLVLVWRYVHEGRDRYLYLGSAVLALAFATKETAYFIALIFGGILFLLALPDLAPWTLGRQRLREFREPAGFLVLLVTLTLPQWSAASGLLQSPLGLTLVSPEGGERGLVGAPQWAAPFVALPLTSVPAWAAPPAAALFICLLTWFVVGKRAALPPLLAGAAAAVLSVVTVYLAVFGPVGSGLASTGGPALADFLLAAASASLAVGLLAAFRIPWKRGALLVSASALAAFVYIGLFTPVVQVGPLVNSMLPGGVVVDAPSNGVPVNYVVAIGVLAFTLLASVYLGMRWRGGVWLASAAVFYTIWTALYTTLFTNWAGIFSGVWQGMGYWIAQQEVARGNQPWYYYFIGVSVYEFLPVIFGILGAVYFVKKGDVLGLALTAWAGLTLLAYTVAAEKMPWLLVNITLPFILLSGKYLGGLAEQVPWRQYLRNGLAASLLLPPLALALGGYFLYRYVNIGNPFSLPQVGILCGAAAAALASAYLVRRTGPSRGLAMTSLSIAALLLAFGSWGAVRASYTYDDSNKEWLVYAQGSSDLQETFQELETEVLDGPEERRVVSVDYDMWYPFQWYVRHTQRQDLLNFACFKQEGEDGWNQGCSPVTATPDAEALLLTATHSNQGDGEALTPYEKVGPRRNLLWFPESYRRPGENRQEEGMGQQLAKDYQFFREAAASRATWQSVLDYLFLRRMDPEWYQSEYYVYTLTNRPMGR